MNIVVYVSLMLFVMALGAVALRIRCRIMPKQRAENDLAGGIVVYRAELERLIKLARREWTVLVYFVPSYITLLFGGLIFDQRPGKGWRYGMTVVAGIVSAGMVFWIGRKKTRCLQRDLDAIKSM